jgi:hypothetical protein
MKTTIYLLLAACMLTLFSSCKKKTSETSDGGPTVIFSSKFDSSADLQLWSQSSGGLAVIDQNSAKLTATNGCFQFETKNLIPVVTGKSYILTFTGKVIQHEVGDPVLCAGDYLIYIMQGNSVLISHSFGNYPDWTQKSFSFQATSSSAIGIKFLVGTTRGAWVDDLTLTQQ